MRDVTRIEKYFLETKVDGTDPWRRVRTYTDYDAVQQAATEYLLEYPKSKFRIAKETLIYEFVSIEAEASA